jgi:predicted nucleic acid-binding protein
MKESILVNIDVIIEYLKTGKGLLPQAYENYKMFISASTNAELLASKTFKDDGLKSEVKDFVKKYFEIITIDTDISEETGRILREFEVNFATALVASVAIKKDMQLLTADVNSFEKIDNVKILSM